MRIRFLLLFVIILLPASLFATTTTEPLPTFEDQLEIAETSPKPFGSDLFHGNFAKGTFDELNAGYLIMPGDRISIRFWGARTYDSVLEVDARGNLFLPEIGPVAVAGVKHSELGSLVQEKVKSVYKNNVEVYTNLLNAQPVAVYVTGFVVQPGRYAGGATDSILYYLDLAGGIDPERGSYRDIRVIRNGEVMERIDLYPFFREGRLERPRFEDGDLILVEERGAGIVVQGQVRHSARFEFPTNDAITGAQLVTLATPQNRASHVSIIGTHNRTPFNTYLPLAEFYDLTLEDGDIVEFHADTPGDTIMVAATGAIVGASRYPINKSTRLLELLKTIPVEPELANMNGIHIKRRSTAIAQKKALNDALRRLEQTSLNATSQGAEEANIRVREAELISQFVNKARKIQPDGTVVVGRGGELSDIYLEDGDVIVIPKKSDVILISGEVLMPKAVVFNGRVDVDDYIENAGGFSTRADKRNILIVKPNGEVFRAGDVDIAAGDQILVLPRIDTKNMQVAKDITQILYQIAIATSVVLGI